MSSHLIQDIQCVGRYTCIKQVHFYEKKSYEKSWWYKLKRKDVLDYTHLPINLVNKNMVIQAKKKSYEKWIKFIEKKRDQNAMKIHLIQLSSYYIPAQNIS
jgi:hypothetical protein